MPNGPPPITRTTLPTCRAHYPGGSNGRSYVASAKALDVRSRLGHVPYMFMLWVAFMAQHFLLSAAARSLSPEGDADVRPGRRKRIPAPALARDRRQAGLSELRLPGLL